MILWRPVGLRELELIFDAAMNAFPPRLASQPVFYPVLNAEYATQIARDWNAREEPFAGYVTNLELPDPYVARFEKKVVGGRQHEEIWVPAEELGEINHQLARPIAVEAAYFGSGFRGHVPSFFNLGGKDARQQIQTLVALWNNSKFDLHLESQANALTIFLNFPFWLASTAADLGVPDHARAAVLESLREGWRQEEHHAALIERAERVV